jgi:hypothetical protein
MDMGFGGGGGGGGWVGGRGFYTESRELFVS